MSAITKIMAVGGVAAAVGLGIGVGLSMSQPAVLLLMGCVVGVICAGASTVISKHGVSPAEPSPPQFITYNDFRTVIMPSPQDSPGRQAARQLLARVPDERDDNR